MAKIKIDTIGFTECAKLKRAEKMIRFGIGVVIGGTLMITSGLKRITNTQAWFATENDKQKEILTNMCNKFERDATD